MPRARDELQAAIKEHVAPLLRAHDFKGTFPTWRVVGDRADTAVVNVQLSSWNTKERARIYINLSLAPDPWLDWEAARFGRPRPKTIQENHGLWRDRLEPPAEWRHDWESTTGRRQRTWPLEWLNNSTSWDFPLSCPWSTASE